jgi:hypothetical protein
MLENYAMPQVSDGHTFQHDGAPPHYWTPVTEFLNQHFARRWIGRGGPIPWPPRSPDLTPLDFFLWGYVKDIVYHTKVNDLPDLRRRITDAVASVTPKMLRNTWIETEYRLDVCRATNGAHVEIYWYHSKFGEFIHVSRKTACMYLN